MVSLATGGDGSRRLRPRRCAHDSGKRRRARNVGRPGADRGRLLHNYPLGYCPPQYRWNVAERTVIDDALPLLGLGVRECGVTAHVHPDRKHVIYLPRRSRWASTEWRAATLAHEVMHALGDWVAPDRREESIAEIGAILLFEWLGWEYPDEEFSYLLSRDTLGWCPEDVLDEVVDRLGHVIQALLQLNNPTP